MTDRNGAAVDTAKTDFVQDLQDRRAAVLTRLDALATETEALRQKLAPLETLLRLEGVEITSGPYVSPRMTPAEKEAAILRVLADHEGELTSRRIYELAGLDGVLGFDGFKKAIERLRARGAVVSRKESEGTGSPCFWSLAE